MTYPRYVCGDCGKDCDTPCPEAVKSMGQIRRWEQKLKRRLIKKLGLSRDTALDVVWQVALYCREDK